MYYIDSYQWHRDGLGRLFSLPLQNVFRKLHVDECVCFFLHDSCSWLHFSEPFWLAGLEVSSRRRVRNWINELFNGKGSPSPKCYPWTDQTEGTDPTDFWQYPDCSNSLIEGSTVINCQLECPWPLLASGVSYVSRKMSHPSSCQVWQRSTAISPDMLAFGRETTEAQNAKIPRRSRLRRAHLHFHPVYLSHHFA